jgi:hypothetical protein
LPIRAVEAVGNDGAEASRLGVIGLQCDTKSQVTCPRIQASMAFADAVNEVHKQRDARCQPLSGPRARTLPEARTMHDIISPAALAPPRQVRHVQVLALPATPCVR